MWLVSPSRINDRYDRKPIMTYPTQVLICDYRYEAASINGSSRQITERLMSNYFTYKSENMSIISKIALYDNPCD